MVLLDKSLSTAIYTKIVGSGRGAIVLAHEYGADQSVWDKILPYLPQHFRSEHGGAGDDEHGVHHQNMAEF
jgi:hypothetical protein